MKYNRILLKLSGEALLGKNSYGIDNDRLVVYAEEIKQIHKQGVEIAIVIGGGNIFRGLSGSKDGIDRVQADYMGMLATVINAMAIQAMLEKIISEERFTAKAVFGLFPAERSGSDDISIQKDANTSYVFRTLRQQIKKKEGVAHRALSDYIAPPSEGVHDHMGAFCVTAGFGSEEMALTYQAALDDYNSIMVKALADRLAEAFAEYLHLEVRKEHWGYAAQESLDPNALIAEEYKGIRPAPGYPACPDHLEKNTIWDLLQVEERIGVSLTESLAMWPAASAIHRWQMKAVNESLELRL